MSTNSSSPRKLLKCGARACAKCGYCRDWFWNPDGKMKVYTKRPDATCTANYSFGNSGFGPGCVGCLLCCAAHVPWANLCVSPYYGGNGYSHGVGIPLNGFLHGGLDNNIAALAGVDVAARDNRREDAAIADIFTGGMASFATGMSEFSDGTLTARRAIHRAHHDMGHVCQCDDNQQ